MSYLPCQFLLYLCQIVNIQQGTNVSSGKARGVVIGTGMNTEIGMFAFLLLVCRLQYCLLSGN